MQLSVTVPVDQYSSFSFPKSGEKYFLEHLFLVFLFFCFFYGNILSKFCNNLPFAFQS